MKCIFTYYTNNGANLCCGLTEPFFKKIALISTTSAARVFGEIYIYTDVEGAKHLDSVGVKANFVIVDYAAYKFDSRFWNFPKLITYSMQQQRFIHIDFDTYLRPNFAEMLPDTNIITELVRSYTVGNVYRSILPLNYSFPKGLICSGLIGGNDGRIWKDLLGFAKVVVNTHHDDVTLNHLTGIEELILSSLSERNDLSVKAINSSTFLHFQGAKKEQKYNYIVDKLYSEIC